MNKKIIPLILLSFLVLSMFAPLATVKADTTLNNGLVGYWNFDEGSGSTIIDYSGNNNHFTSFQLNYINGVYLNAGNLGGNTSSYITSSSSQLNEAFINFSLSCWIKPYITNGYLGFMGFSASNNGFSIHYYPNSLSCRIWNSTSFNTYYDIYGLSNNTWINLVMTYQNGLLKIYVNGSYVADGLYPVTGAMSVGTLPLLIGKNWDGAAPTSLDEMRIYNRVLSASEIAELYTYDPNYVAPTPAPTTAPTTNQNQGLDILIFVFMVVIEIALLILAIKFKGLGLLGLFGGLLGAIFAYICFTSSDLILNTAYDQTAQAFVYQTYPIEFFAWVPLILAISNFIAAVYSK